jgi:hypothetical protein
MIWAQTRELNVIGNECKLGSSLMLETLKKTCHRNRKPRHFRPLNDCYCTLQPLCFIIR